MVCFAPTVTLDWSALLQHFRNVFQALHNIGFRTIVVGLDGHKTNVKFFTQLSGGDLRIRIQNPFDNSLPVFLLFDSVHLMKNFFNNFKRKRYQSLFKSINQTSILLKSGPILKLFLHPFNESFLNQCCRYTSRGRGYNFGKKHI